MDNTKVSAQPAHVDVEKEVVLVDAPGGAIVSLTPEAAAETASRLARAADKASDPQASEKSL